MIGVNNLTTKEVDEDFLKRVAQEVLKQEGAREEAELSIVLLGSGRMRKLNKKHRGKNRVTDVLSFASDKKLPAGKTVLGEIVICLREVAKNAKRLNSTFEKEIANCLIHGLLHLLGYEHEKGETEAKEMQAKQKYYLSKLGFK